MGVPHNTVLRGRQKVFHTKSRTGCQICRTRRVRCDETRPSCRNCTRLGFQCEGPKLTFIVNREQQLDVWSLQDTDSRMPPMLTDNLFATAKENAAFQFFLEKTLPWFSSPKAPNCDGDLCYRFWCPTALQMMHHEPLIKHLVLATATSHGYVQDIMVAATFGEKKGIVDRRFDRDVFLLHHYGKAIRILREQTADISTILVACLIVAMVEYFRYQPRLFLQHLEFGERIVRDHYSEDGTLPICDGSNVTGEGGQRKYSASSNISDACDSRIRECVIPTLNLLKSNSGWMVELIS